MSQEPSAGHVTFDEFKHIVAEELQVAEDKVTPEASFLGDLFADSLRLVQLMLHMEEMGISIPMERAWQVETVGDAYQLYAAQAPSETEM
ncbi:MAG: acyl carrier protein [Anaerolineae bacterium]